MPRRPDVPVYRPDIYSPRAILDPYPHYAALRELGPVVRLPKHNAYALPRYAECRAALLDHKTFVSGDGVGLNPVINRLSRGTTLTSDGEDHTRRRALVAHRLTPRALRDLTDDIRRRADEIVAAAVARRTVDGAELAAALPLSVVPDLVGWPQEGREHLLTWGAATFDALGPANGQAVKAIPAGLAMMRFARDVVRHRTALPGSMGADLLTAADNGTLTHAECPALMIDYLAPSLDTTLSGIAGALHLFATHPAQWQHLRQDPTLIPNAVNEVLRFASPLRAFSRKVAHDTELAGTALPAGTRVLVLYASANRDPLVWEDPDTFTIHRNASRHLAFGQGKHGCAGQGLARLETEAFLAALVARVATLAPAGPPRWSPNNIIHRLEHLPLELTPA
ncbi:cytochrome P450 [Actinokineospora bangkokensis]|uniref:Monooxygenase n=1 Tax=Actinokineospora bangkokensis TaxID=1193682 RepID=A0A1Q9LLC2_9PSEU|nr:cytochrome P450 [Actinokineospora bangkokensis]OLR92815.1 monooxygenase [Actinokineospora bangkokensis]